MSIIEETGGNKFVTRIDFTNESEVSEKSKLVEFITNYKETIVGGIVGFLVGNLILYYILS